MTLRARLLFLVGSAVAITVALVTWTVSRSARTAFEAFDEQRTSALMTEFRREVVRQGEDVERRVERIVSSDAFQRTMVDIARHQGEYGQFVNEAGALSTAQGLDFVDLAADDGTLISSAEWPARFGYRVPWIAEAATRGNVFLRPVELPRALALGLVAVRRVVSSGRTFYIAGGRRLDEQFLKSLRLPAGMRVLLYQNVEPEISRRHLIAAGGSVTQAARLEPLIARVRQTGTDISETIVWPDGPEAIDASPLTGQNGDVLGVLILGSSNRELVSLLARIRWSGIVFGIAGVAFGVALSYLLASRVTRPVEQLAAAAREISDGNWDVHAVDSRATSEIAELARTFDTMTRQLVDQRERLVQAERVAAWRELARRLAHELKNPLFPLRLTLENLRRARTLPDAQFDEIFEESLTTMSTGLSNLNSVIGRFSDFAKVPAPELTTVDPNAIVQQAVALFRAQVEAPNRPPIAIKVDLDASASPIRADGEQMGRVVQNLLLNAIDAMPNGGELKVRTRQNETMFEIAITDTGEGLTEEECRRLFTPYYTTKQHGTGLGLAIVQSIVADHHGKVWVDSTRGRGTIFHVALPVTRGEIPA